MSEAKNFRYYRISINLQPGQVSRLCSFPLPSCSSKCIIEIYRAHYGDAMFVLLRGAQIWRPKIMQTSGFGMATNLNSCSLRTSKLLPFIHLRILSPFKGHDIMRYIFFHCDGLLARHINVTRSKLGKLERAIFSNGKSCHVENLHRRLFLRYLLLDEDKTLKVLAILEFEIFVTPFENQEYVIAL